MLKRYDSMGFEDELGMWVRWADYAAQSLELQRAKARVMAAFHELDGHTLFESYDLLRQRIDVLREALAALKQSRGAT